jgi:hypothetical protein
VGLFHRGGFAQAIGGGGHVRPRTPITTAHLSDPARSTKSVHLPSDEYYESRLAEAYRDGTIPVLPDAFVRLITSAHRGNGKDPAYEASANATKVAEPVDVELELANMAPGIVNATQCRVIGSLLSRGIAYQEIADTVIDATMRMATAHGLSDWTRDEEATYVGRRMSSILNTRCREDTTAITGDAPPAWVAPELLPAWNETIRSGGRPNIVWRKGSGWYVRDTSRLWRDDAPTPAQATPDTPREETSSKPKDPPKPNKPTEPRIGPKPFGRVDFSTIPLREWLYGRHYMRGIASATIGPGGIGKSSLDLLEAIAMATARPLLGEAPSEQLRVWYHNGEDAPDELDRRIAAACVLYEIDPHELAKYLFVTSGIEMPIKIASGNGDFRLNGAVIRDLIVGIQTHNIDVLILDPLITLHSLAEAENHKMDPVIREFHRIGMETGCAIELGHHTRKKVTGQEEYSVADARGASAIIDAVRSARTINALNDANAKLLNVTDEVERLSYFRVDRGKANYTRRGAPQFFRFASIDLPNGPGGTPGDEVGVVERVTSPDATIEMSASDIEILRAEVANADWAVDKKSDTWFGKAVAKHFGLDLTMGLDTTKVENAIARLRGLGIIIVEPRNPRPGSSNRRRRDFYGPGSK